MFAGMLVFAAILGVITGAIAQSKGRSFAAWWLFGAALFIVAFPAILLVGGATRKCPHCSENIKRDAQVCRFCDRDVEPEEGPHYLTPERTAEIARERAEQQASVEIDARERVDPRIVPAIVVAIIIALSALVVIGSLKSPARPVSSQQPDAPSIATAPTPVLRAGKWHWQEEYNYVTAEGLVTNISSDKLERVEAVVTFTTSRGELVTTETGMIEYTPLMPGQTSPWKVMTRANPAMNNAALEFKTMGGGTLPTTHAER